jgi:hypothetical protein
MAQGQPVLGQIHIGARVDRQHRLQRRGELGAELAVAAVLGTELRLQRRPGDVLRARGRDAMQPLRQPGVDVEAQGRALQRRTARMSSGTA